MKDADELDVCSGALMTLLLATSIVGTVLVARLVCGLLWWPQCSVCGERHADLMTWTIETAPGRKTDVCTDCAHRIMTERLAE